MKKPGAIEKAAASGARRVLSAAWEEGPNGVRGHVTDGARAVAGRARPLLIDTVRRPRCPPPAPRCRDGPAVLSGPPGRTAHWHTCMYPHPLICTAPELRVRTETLLDADCRAGRGAVPGSGERFIIRRPVGQSSGET